MLYAMGEYNSYFDVDEFKLVVTLVITDKVDVDFDIVFSVEKDIELNTDDAKEEPCIVGLTENVVFDLV
jgi:hypothetical protein